MKKKCVEICEYTWGSRQCLVALEGTSFRRPAKNERKSKNKNNNKNKKTTTKQKWQKPNTYCSLRDLFPPTCESELGNQQQQHQQDQRKYQQQFAISICYAISTISISFYRPVKLSMEIKMKIPQHIIQYQNENTQQQQQQQPSTLEGAK